MNWRIRAEIDCGFWNCTLSYEVWCGKSVDGLKRWGVSDLCLHSGQQHYWVVVELTTVQQANTNWEHANTNRIGPNMSIVHISRPEGYIIYSASQISYKNLALLFIWAVYR